jgi:hypothetical protein
MRWRLSAFGGKADIDQPLLTNLDLWVHGLIEDAWPQQRKGIVPVDESHRITALQARLALFEPQTKAQEPLHENTLRQFNTFYEDRRARIYSLKDWPMLAMFRQTHADSSLDA